MAKTAFSPPRARLPFAPSVLIARGVSSRSSISPSHAFESRARAARNGFFAAAAAREQRVECNERIEFIYGGGWRNEMRLHFGTVHPRAISIPPAPSPAHLFLVFAE